MSDRNLPPSNGSDNKPRRRADVTREEKSEGKFKDFTGNVLSVIKENAVKAGAWIKKSFVKAYGWLKINSVKAYGWLKINFVKVCKWVKELAIKVWKVVLIPCGQFVVKCYKSVAKYLKETKARYIEYKKSKAQDKKEAPKKEDIVNDEHYTANEISDNAAVESELNFVGADEDFPFNDDIPAVNAVVEPLPSSEESMKSNKRKDKKEKKSLAQRKEEVVEIINSDDSSALWNKSRRPFFVSSILVYIIRVCVILAFVAGFVGLGIAGGVLRAYISSTPELKIDELTSVEETSYIYDINGELICPYYGLENREWVSLEEIPQTLINAFIASEDESFYEHPGFNIRRLVASAIQTFTGGNVQGGSTITQQLLKMTVLTSEQTYKRKLQEIYLATQLEKEYTKDQILECYLNEVPMGGLIYGVKIAAEDYFGKELSELDLRECAMLAGLIQSPDYYHLRKNFTSVEDGGREEPERNYKRANYVLYQMYSCDYITQEEYEAAYFDLGNIEEIDFTVQAEGKTSDYPCKYYLDYAINDLIAQIMELNDCTSAEAQAFIRTSGLKIYTALDITKQEAVEQVVYNYPLSKLPSYSNKGNSVSINGVPQPQMTCVIMDNETGYLVAIVGGKQEPEVQMGLNRAYNSLLPMGSAIKPIAVYAPFVELGAPGGMVVDNIPTAISGWRSKLGFPYNHGSGKYTGPTSISYAMVNSLNIPAARVLLERVSIANSQYYLRKMGISESGISSEPSNLSLGSGGTSVLESVAAYTLFTNGGSYIEPISIRYVEDLEGNQILNNETPVKHEVFSESTAFIISQWMVRVANMNSIKLSYNSGIQFAVKTGTNEERSIGMVGFSPYYTCRVWIGHDDYGPKFSGSVSSATYCSPVFKKLMEAVHEGKEAKKLFDTTPENVIQVTVCPVSGKLPRAGVCVNDMNGRDLVTEWYVKGTEPTEVCDCHVMATLCKETNKLATDLCPEECRVRKAVIVLDSNSDYLKLLEEVKIYDEEDITEENPEGETIYNYTDVLDYIYPTYIIRGTESIMSPDLDAYKRQYCYNHTRENKLIADCKTEAQLTVDVTNALFSAEPYKSAMTELEKNNLTNLEAAIWKVFTDYEYLKANPPVDEEGNLILGEDGKPIEIKFSESDFDIAMFNYEQAAESIKARIDAAFAPTPTPATPTPEATPVATPEVTPAA